MNVLDDSVLSAPEGGIRLRALLPEDLSAGLVLSTRMRWPYRLEDWAFAFRLGHGVALIEGQRVVGTGLWWPYGESAATFGMIIIEPELQGRGLGRAIVRQLLDAAGERTVLLNSTREGLRLYMSFGFDHAGSLGQHQGVLRETPTPTAASKPVRAATLADLPALIDLDSRASGLPRERLLSELMQAGEAALLERSGNVMGYAISRRFGRGHVIGPVVAPDRESAQALIQFFFQRLRGTFVRIDVPSEHAFGPWLASAGLERVDEAVPMVRGRWPASSGDARVFALASQSLG